jgi:hypothetical protein
MLLSDSSYFMKIFGHQIFAGDGVMGVFLGLFRTPSAIAQINRADAIAKAL